MSILHKLGLGMASGTGGGSLPVHANSRSRTSGVPISAVGAARTGIARIEADLKRAERILVESRRPGAGHAARSRARVADDFELLYRARFPRLIGRHSSRVESISDRR